MALYFKFKSEKGFDSVPVHAPLVSVREVKEKISLARYSRNFNNGKLITCKDFDFVITNLQTNEDYTDEAALIPRNTSVIVRRVPGMPRLPIVAEQENSEDAVSGMEEASESRSTLSVANSAEMSFPIQEKSEGYDFGDDIFASLKVGTTQSRNQGQKHMILEDRKIKELADKHAGENSKIKEWAEKPSEDNRSMKAFVKSSGRDMGSEMKNGSCIGQDGLLRRKTPPGGYICHRCQVPGHYIQHCPTNGDPSYDSKCLKQLVGIPKSMLVEDPGSSYALPNGVAATLKPNKTFCSEASVASPSAPFTNVLPELLCPLCKKLIKDAAFSKCCFRSFCDKCIRDHIVSKSACVCGATDGLSHALIPNRTLREMIKSFLESTESSEEKTRSWSQLLESNSSCCTQSKSATRAPAPVMEDCAPICKEDTSVRKRCASGGKTRPESVVIAEEATSGNERVSHGHTPPAEEKILQRQPVGEPGKKRRKTVCGSANDVDLRRRSVQEAANDYQFWASTQWAANGYMVPYGGYMHGSFFLH